MDKRLYRVSSLLMRKWYFTWILKYYLQFKGKASKKLGEVLAKNELISN
jgi:hypothetical protein